MDPISLGVMTAVSIGSSVVGGAISAYGAVKKGEAEADRAREQAFATAEAKGAEAASSDYLAAVARNNAIIARQNKEYELSTSKILAGFEREAGRAGASEKLREAGITQGKQRAAFAASGVDVNRGTPEEVQESTLAMGELDAATILANAERKAWGYDIEGGRRAFGFESQAQQFESEAGFRGLQSQFARKAGGTAIGAGERAAEGFESAATISALGSVIGGASSVSDKWLSYKNKGIV